MKRGWGLVVAAILAAVVPHVSLASGSPLCRVLNDASGDVSDSFGAPAAGTVADVDLTSVDAKATSTEIRAIIHVANLRTDTEGALYGVFFNVGSLRYFLQATRAEDQWTFSAGISAASGDRLPQQGIPASGRPKLDDNSIEIDALRSFVGSPQDGTTLEQIRAASHQTGQNVAIEDRTEGDGGRFLIGSTSCISSLSNGGERCVVATDSPTDAKPGPTPDASQYVSLPQSGTDEATEITSVQIGSNPDTVVVDVFVASLLQPIPQGSDGERWDVSWNQDGKALSAYALRNGTGVTFGYGWGTRASYTTGALDTSAGVVRILVPRADFDAFDGTRMTSIRATASVEYATYSDERDSAPNGQRFDAEYVVGTTCAAQAEASCPVVLDDARDASTSGTGAADDQPGSDLLAAGAATNSSQVTVTMRVSDLSSGPSGTFNWQGWTASWTVGGRRWFAQAERTETGITYSYGITQPTDQPPSDADKANRNATTGSFELSANRITIVVPRAALGGSADGQTFKDFGATSAVASDSGDPTGTGNSAAPMKRIDSTPVAPYNVGIGCGA